MPNWEEIIDTALDLNNCTVLCDEARSRMLRQMRKKKEELEKLLSLPIHSFCTFCLLSHRREEHSWRFPNFRHVCRSGSKGFEGASRRFWLELYKNLINGAY